MKAQCIVHAQLKSVYGHMPSRTRPSNFNVKGQRAWGRGLEPWKGQRLGALVVFHGYTRRLRFATDGGSGEEFILGVLRTKAKI